MALNGLLNTNYRVEVEALVVFLEQFVTRWSSAPTAEERALVESEALGVFERLVDLQYEQEELVAGTHPESTEMNEYYSHYSNLYRINVIKLQKLGQMFLEYFNTEQLVLLELLGKLRRIQQKRASLAIWQDGEAKYVIADHFLNLDWIDQAFSKEPICNVAPSMGLLTLPVSNRVPVLPRRARVGSRSNGVPGNSDLAVTDNRNNPNFALNTDVNNWFEYERLDAGPLALSYVVEFSREEILNEISVSALNLSGSYNFEVEDILFNGSAGTISIKELLPKGLGDDFWTVRSVGRDSSWVVAHLPTKAKTVTIKFRQRSSYPIAVATGDNRTVLRNRWLIALKQVKFARNKYEKEGTINSVEHQIPAGLYAALPFISVAPRKPELFDAQFEMSVDGGESWVAADNLDDGIGATLLMDGNASPLVWRLALSRDDEAIGNVTSLVETETKVKEVQSVLRTVSRFQSPATISLPSTTTAPAAFAFQPKVGRRGDRFKAVSLGDTAGGVSSFLLPFSVADAGLDPEQVSVYVNRRPYTYVQDGSTLGTGEWSFSSDMKEIELTDQAPNNSAVTIAFEAEKMDLVPEGDGYYHEMEMLFDPDKENIEITALPREGKWELVQLPKDRTFIVLPHKSIYWSFDNSIRPEGIKFSLKSQAGTSYIEVTNQTMLASTPNSFLVDYTNGQLWLNAAFDADTVWAQYYHYNPVDLTPDDFDIVYDGIRPSGVRIKQQAFQSAEHTDTMGATNLDVVMNVVSGSVQQRANVTFNSSTTATLSYDRIIQGSLNVSDNFLAADTPAEEVPYQDGSSEFKGLVFVSKEETVSITAGTGLTYVEFNLSAGALYDQDFGVLFADTNVFRTLGSTVADAQSVSPLDVGTYFIDDAGLMTVCVGSGGTLPEGKTFSYFYVDPEFNPSNKYSVDYHRGLLHAGAAIFNGSKVTYQAASFKVSYDIGMEIDKYSYSRKDRSVECRTEGLADINSLVKVLYESKSGETSMSEFAQFFSPPYFFSGSEVYLMALSNAYKLALKRRVVQKFITDNNRAPNEVELRLLLESEYAAYPNLDSVGIIGYTSTRPQFREVSSVEKETSNREALYDDMSTLSARLENLSKVLEDSFRGFYAVSRQTFEELDHLEDRADTLLLVNGDTDVFVAGISEDLHGQDYIDWNNTTAQVENGYCTLDRTGYTPIDLNSVDLNFSLISEKGVLSSSPVSGIDSIRRQDGDIWQYMANTTYAQGRVSLVIQASLPKPSYVGDLRLYLAPIAGTAPLTASVFYSIDGGSFATLEPAEQVLSQQENQWSVGKEGVQKIQIVLSKKAADSKTPTGSQHIYAWMIDALQIFTDTYRKNSVSELYAGPYEIKDATGNAVAFTKAKLHACTVEPLGTSTDFFLSTDNTNWLPVSHDGLAPDYVTFGSGSRTGHTAVFDGGLIPEALVENPGILDLNFSSEACLNMYIPAASIAKVPLRGISLRRNSVGSLSPSVLNGAAPGWSQVADGGKLRTTVLIDALEGRYIDFGPRSINVDGVDMSGKVLLTSGKHVLLVASDSWSAVPAGLGTAEALREADSLYPYNHRLLIEGYTYSSVFQGERVYNGVSLYYGYEQEYMSPEIFDQLTMDSPRYWKSYTHVDTDIGRFLKVKVDKSDSSWSSEQYVSDWIVQSQTDNKLYVRAVLSSSETSQTPTIDSYKVTVI